MAYNTRRSANVSEYIANLNAIPTEQDMQAREEFKFDDDLAMFTNTNFFDFDIGQAAGLSVPPVEFSIEGNELSDTPGIKPMNLDFSFSDFSNFNRSPDIIPGVAPPKTNSSYPASSPTTSPTLGLISPSIDQASNKRNAQSVTSSDNTEESALITAEEDKRRRNTAASARFRVKKKQREQALEKSAKEMGEKVAALEGKINQLETENKWLKNLITEKNAIGHKGDIGKASKAYNVDAKGKSERIGEERKDGVGTKA